MADNVVKLKPSAPDSLTVKISTSSGHLGRVANKSLQWPALCARLSDTAWDSVTMKEFRAKPIAWQHERKNQGYFVGGQFKTGARKLQNMTERSMLTFDIDNSTPGFMADIQTGLSWLGDFEYFFYTTRSHTPENPRVRVVVPLAAPIEIAKLAPLSRIIAQKLDAEMEVVDPVSFRPAQVMYWPNTCRGSEFLSGRNEGPLLDGNAELLGWGDWQDYSKLPRSAREKQLRESGDKAQDPFAKRGPPGAFCRAYPISAAIEKFLSDVYEPGEGGTDGQPRYSFLAGSTRNGAVVYDDDRFLYSNHGTDPVADTLVNSYDLVRIHLFGDKDKVDATGFITDKVTELPSYKAMVDFIQADKGYVREMRDDQYDLDAVFTDTVDDDEQDEAREPERMDTAAHAEPSAKAPVEKVGSRPEVTSSPADWMDRLEITEKGLIRVTLHNIATILIYDPRFRGRLAYNEFLEEPVLVRRIRSKQFGHDTGPIQNKENGDYISGTIESAIRAILESPRGEDSAGYSLRVPDRDMKDGITAAALEFRFHPVKNYLRRCHAARDGGVRIRKLFHTYAHAEDNAYHEAVAYNFMVGAVARIFEPGCKFDFVPILEGPQGIRKSTFLAILGGLSRFGELKNNFDDTAKLVEQIQGKWILEIPELAQFNRTDIETLKAVFSGQSDRTRLAWGRGAKDYKRQCVFAGTTNRRVYLKDDENRRFWPVKLPRDIPRTIDTEALAADIDQLWAEAYEEYLWMRRRYQNYEEPLPLHLTGEVAAFHKEVAQARTEINSDEILAGQVSAWLDTPVPEPMAQVGYRGDIIDEIDTDCKLLPRNRTCLKDIMFYVLGKTDKEGDAKLSQQLSRVMADLPNWRRHGALVWIPGLGPQRVFDRILNH